MEFKRKGPEAAEIQCTDGKRVLFSYGEPVAVFHPRSPAARATFWRVDDYVSRTTERHITEFVTDGPALRVPRAVIRAMVERSC